LKSKRSIIAAALSFANVGKAEIGMIVDEVSEVLTIPDNSIEPSLAIKSTINLTFITGIAKVDTRLIILLDLFIVLSVQE
jgi:purine-binding chemotaxis protein CheW